MNQRLRHLDLLRGLSALAVCAEHLRTFLFVDFAQTSGASVADRAFYFVTAFGHEAVIVFFVLSGFFVGGSVLSAWNAGVWSWTSYASRRLARLWCALLPALIATLVLDVIGRELLGANGYDGSMRAVINSSPHMGGTNLLSFSTFIGNMAFLQTIVVPVYGTNSPLWSLANEFWYYLLFPLGVAVWRGRGRRPGERPFPVVALMALMGLLWLLPWALVSNGLIWLFGVAAYAACQDERWKRPFQSLRWLAGFGVAFAASLIAARTTHWQGSDFAVGATFAALVPGLALKNQTRAAYERCATGLADISYTLYLNHFPLMALVWFSCFAPARLQPELASYGLYATGLLVTMAYCWVMWWCFERNTDAVRTGLASSIMKLTGRTSTRQP